MNISAKPKPYDRQPSETDKSWAAFCAYRDMGRERSLDKLDQARTQSRQKRSYSVLKDWSSKHAWVKRCSVFDDEELERESIELQKLRLSRRLQMEKQAWERRDKLIKKADTIARVPLLKPEVSEDGTQIFMPTDKWSIKDAIAFYEYADRLGIFATGGGAKKLDEVEAVTILADAGLLPATAVVAISQGFEQFKNVIKEALLNENESTGERDNQDGKESAFSDILGQAEDISAPTTAAD